MRMSRFQQTKDKFHSMRLLSGRGLRLTIVVFVALLGAFAAFVLPPLEQPPQYHKFADRRVFFGIPNFFNVASNAAFIAIGLLGLGCLLGQRATGRFIRPSDKLPYLIFFLGIVLTGVGSAYYHRAPDNAALAWDRFPMTIAFMSILAATIAERINARIGLFLLGPLIIAGIGSIFYWQVFGNLWPYAAVQYFSIVLVGLMILLFPSRYTHGTDLFGAGSLYAVAKVAELSDAPVYSVTGLVSGHTLKHLISALACYCVLRMLLKRVPVHLNK